MKVEFITADYSHIDHIARNMRQCDRQEIWAASHELPHESLEQALSASPYAQTAMLDGVPCAMYGVAVANFMDDIGAPWMLATDDLEVWSLWFLKRSIRVIREMLDCCPHLFNYVDARNVTSIKWLKWLKFNVSEEPEVWGQECLPFHRFELKRS